jgi:hypothetical protein
VRRAHPVRRALVNLERHVLDNLGQEQGPVPRIAIVQYLDSRLAADVFRPSGAPKTLRLSAANHNHVGHRSVFR